MRPQSTDGDLPISWTRELQREPFELAEDSPEFSVLSPWEGHDQVKTTFDCKSDPQGPWSGLHQCLSQLSFNAANLIAFSLFVRSLKWMFKGIPRGPHSHPHPHYCVCLLGLREKRV